MDAKEKMQALLETSKAGTVTAAQVSAAGLHRSILQELVESGELYRFSRGLYVQNNAWEDDFYLLQLKYGRGIYSHDTALYLLGYSDRTPAKYTMTFPKGYNASSLKKDLAKPKPSPHPVTQSVFTTWNGPCVTYCAAVVMIFRLSDMP